MPNYRYRAVNNQGEIVDGLIASSSTSELWERLDQLGLVLVEEAKVQEPGFVSRLSVLVNQPTSEDITAFTQDLAFLLKAGTRIHDAIDFLADAGDQPRIRPLLEALRARVMAGDSFGEALTRHPKFFPPVYVALVQVGEVSGSLDRVLEVIAAERQRVQALRTRLGDAVRYPAFVLFAAGAVLTFFLTFVLPQFATVLQGFGAKIDPLLGIFFRLSNFLNDNATLMAAVALGLVCGAWLLMRREAVRRKAFYAFTRLPLIRKLMIFYCTGVFCRNLGLLLGSGVSLTLALRILVDIMETLSPSAVWREIADRVRRGAKLSEAVARTGALPKLATGMLRLGDETGQLPGLAGRVAEFYENKLHRALDRLVGMVGPAAIILISVVVGGLITSVMTALLSVSQVVG